MAGRSSVLRQTASGRSRRHAGTGSNQLTWRRQGWSSPRSATWCFMRGLRCLARRRLRAPWAPTSWRRSCRCCAVPGWGRRSCRCWRRASARSCPRLVRAEDGAIGRLGRVVRSNSARATGSAGARAQAATSKRLPTRALLTMLLMKRHFPGNQSDVRWMNYGACSCRADLSFLAGVRSARRGVPAGPRRSGAT